MADIKKVVNISITKSASPIPATFLLQVLEEGKANPDAEILAQLVRGEITRRQAFCLMHPIVSISILPGVLMALLVYILN